MMVEPPGVPTTINNFPPFSTMVGVIELNILLFGAMALASPPTKPYIFGAPGLTEKSSISLLSRKPAPFTATNDP
ncbi:hypothetical protein D3C72_2062230 [compost metagenome]